MTVRIIKTVLAVLKMISVVVYFCPEIDYYAICKYNHIKKGVNCFYQF